MGVDKQMNFNEWDYAIMEKFPYVLDLAKPTDKVFDAIDFIKENFIEGTYSWKGPRFYFAKESDRTRFSLTWPGIINHHD